MKYTGTGITNTYGGFILRQAWSPKTKLLNNINARPNNAEA
jgi:hypothetical protein